MIAERGNLEVLRWARRHGCPWSAESVSKTCRAAASAGQGLPLVGGIIVQVELNSGRVKALYTSHIPA